LCEAQGQASTQPAISIKGQSTQSYQVLEDLIFVSRLAENHTLSKLNCNSSRNHDVSTLILATALLDWITIEPV